ncbi:MAG: hypothetical protein ACRDKE_05495, partial [Solirubrobacterales bacterium]
MTDTIKFGDFPDVSVEDRITTTISPATDPTTVEVVLVAGPKVTWWKSIEVKTLIPLPFGVAETDGPKRGPITIKIPNALAADLRVKFSKAKMFGVHTGMYELRTLGALTGKRVTFEWVDDVHRGGAFFGFLRDLGNGINQAANAVGSWIAGAFKWVGGLLGDVIEAIGTAVANGLDALGNVLGGLPGGGALLKGFLHWVGTIVSGFFSLAAAFVKGVFD